jgi:hypothetical protein
MSAAERIAIAVVGVAFATTLILPDRQTSKVIQAISGLFNESLRTAMGR